MGKARKKAAGDVKRESARLAIAGWGSCNDRNYHNLGSMGHMSTDDPASLDTHVLTFSQEAVSGILSGFHCSWFRVFTISPMVGLM